MSLALLSIPTRSTDEQTPICRAVGTNACGAESSWALATSNAEALPHVAVFASSTRGHDAVVSATLARAGYRVHAGSSAFEAAARGDRIGFIVAVALDAEAAQEALARAASLGEGGRVRVLLCAPLEIVQRLEQSPFDDFLPIPFAPAELALRVQRGSDVRPVAERTAAGLQVGCLSLDLAGREARVDGRLAPLTRLEFELLAFFCRHPRRTLRRQELLAAVWGNVASSRTVDIHIRRLRLKLGAAADVIETQRGVGYKLAGEVRALARG